MLSNKPLGIAGAAMLGTVALLGTNAANAVINLSAEAAMKANPAETYAKETLKAKVDDDSMYYVINGGTDELHVTAELGLAGGGDGDDDLIIQVKLDGMVFTSDSLAGASLSVGNAADISESAGGDKGDTSATFAAKRGSGNDKDTVVTLEIGDLGIMSDGPGGITMTITNVQQRQLLTGILDNPGANVASYPGAIAVKSGLKESAVPKSPTALVSDGFKSFGTRGGSASDPRDLTETVGSFSIAMSAAGLLMAGDGMEVDGVNDLIDVGTEDADVADGASSVTFVGEFGFADMVWLDNGSACDEQSPTDLLKRDSEGMLMDTAALKPQPPATVNANMYLCIMVPESTDEEPVRIPETGKYMAMTTYKAAVDGAAFPPRGGTHELGMIDRDGTTVRLPYLTTNKRFNQRIYIVSRATEAKYVMTFHGEGDEAGMDSAGMLTGGETTILSLGDDDVVTIGPGRTSTSGTLVIEAQPQMIDVATSQINRELGTSDTVVYREE